MPQFKTLSTPANPAANIQLQQRNAECAIRHLTSVNPKLPDRLANFRKQIEAISNDCPPSYELNYKMEYFVRICGIDPGVELGTANYAQAIQQQALTNITLIDSLALIDQSNPNPSIPALTQKCNALQTIQAQIDLGIATIDDLTTISSAIFKKQFPSDTSIQDQIQTAQIDLNHLRQVSNQRLFRSLVSTILTEDSLKISTLLLDAPLHIDATQLTDTERITLEMLYMALADRGQVTLPVSEQWIHVASRLLRLEVTSELLTHMLPAPELPPTQIKMALTSLPEAIQTSMQSFLSDITTMANSTDGDTKDRWTLAQGRLHEAVTILKKADQGKLENRDRDIAKFISDWQANFKNTCSVGVDLRTMEFCSELQSKVEGIEWSDQRKADVKRRIMLQGLITGKLHALLYQIKIPADYITDVHHSNLAMRIIYDGENQPIPQQLNDPHVVGYHEEIVAKSGEIRRGFADPTWVLEAVAIHGMDSGTGTLSFKEFINAFPELAFMPEGDLNAVKIQVIEAMLQRYSMNELRSQFLPKDIRQIHLDLGAHGLLGVAARWGRDDAFNWIRTSLAANVPPIPVLDTDKMGYTLMDYAVLGGNPRLAKEVWEACNSEESQSNFLLESSEKSVIPSLMALAAESGQADMVQYVASISKDYTQAMITKPDSTGHQAIMRAAMSGNSVALKAVIDKATTPDGFVANLNNVNTFGQTALILAIVHGNSADCVKELLDNGANPNQSINGLSPIQLAMMDNDLPILQTLLAHPAIIIWATDLTTVSSKECTVALYTKALQVHPDLLTSPYISIRFGHWLAQHNPAVLSHLLTNLPDENLITILEIQDNSGDTVAQRLATFGVDQLLEILKIRDELCVLKTLLIRHQYWRSLAHWLAIYKPDGLNAILAEKSDAFVTNTLLIDDNTNWTVAQCLAENNVETLLKLLPKITQHNVSKLLLTPYKNKIRIPHWLAEHHPATLTQLLANQTDETVSAILSLYDNSGCTVAQRLATFDIDQLLEILKNRSESVASDNLLILYQNRGMAK